MQGYQITFYTQLDRMHGTIPLAQWLLEKAKEKGIKGATLSGALEGVGHDGQTHLVNMFDLSSQPVQITLIVSTEEASLIFEHLAQEQLHLFYTLMPVEFGTLSAGSHNPLKPLRS